jgi:hypothetical protein
MQTDNKRENGKFAKGNMFGNRWQKGQSGNPAGRPKSALLSDVLRKKLNEQLPDNNDKSISEKIAEKLIELALQGDISAIKEVFDRTEGKPLQKVNASVGVTDWRETLQNYNFDENELLNEAKRLLRNGDGDFDASGE